jgi:hypothetical protein
MHPSVERTMKFRVSMMLVVAALAAGCPKGSDSGDTGVTYDQDARVRGPELGWRPVAVETDVRR